MTTTPALSIRFFVHFWGRLIGVPHAAVDEVGSLGAGGGLQVVQPRKDLRRKAGESR